ncbi:hypothetical protein V8E54_003590 [Elaphomyces granulatus]
MGAEFTTRPQPKKAQINDWSSISAYSIAVWTKVLTLIGVGRTLHVYSNIPKNLWPSPTAAPRTFESNNLGWKTPFEVAHEHTGRPSKKSYIGHLRIFGTWVYEQIPTEEIPRKDKVLTPSQSSNICRRSMIARSWLNEALLDNNDNAKHRIKPTSARAPSAPTTSLDRFLAGPNVEC